MKSYNSHKKTSLTKKEIKRGIYLSPVLDVKEVAVRKVKRDILKEVQFARKAVRVMEYGKAIALIVPVPEE